MKSIEHYEQLAREAKGEGCGHPTCAVWGHRWQATAHDRDGYAATQRCDRCDVYFVHGPSNDRPAAVRLEMELAEHLADTCMLYEPGADRETLEDWLVEGAAVRAHAIVNHDAEQAETGEEG